MVKGFSFPFIPHLLLKSIFNVMSELYYNNYMSSLNAKHAAMFKKSSIQIQVNIYVSFIHAASFTSRL